MNIEEILDLMDDMLERSWSLPLSGGRGVVDAERMRELVDEMRVNLPQVIKQAKIIVSDREEIQRDSKKEAEMIVRKAEDRARILVSQEEVTKQAQAKAAEMISQAQAKAKEIRRAAQEYSDSCLQKSEEVLLKNLQDVKATRQAFRNAVNKQ